MIPPNVTTLAAINAMTDVPKEIKRTDSVQTIIDRCATFQQFTSLDGLKHYLDLDNRWLR